MTLNEMARLFEEASAKSSLTAYEQLPNKRSAYRDLAGMLLLAELDPPEEGQSCLDIIGGARHDEVIFSVSPTAVAANITPEQVAELAACGILYEELEEYFFMFP